jgi:hypothetical protein
MVAIPCFRGVFTAEPQRTQRQYFFSFAAEAPANENHLKLRFIWFQTLRVSFSNMAKLFIASNLPGGLGVFDLPSISGANQKKKSILRPLRLERSGRCNASFIISADSLKYLQIISSRRQRA